MKLVNLLRIMLVQGMEIALAATVSADKYELKKQNDGPHPLIPEGEAHTNSRDITFIPAYILAGILSMIVIMWCLWRVSRNWGSWKIHTPSPRPHYIRTPLGWIDQETWEVKQAKRAKRKEAHRGRPKFYKTTKADYKWVFHDPTGELQRQFNEQKERSYLRLLPSWMRSYPHGTMNSGIIAQQRGCKAPDCVYQSPNAQINDIDRPASSESLEHAQIDGYTMSGALPDPYRLPDIPLLEPPKAILPSNPGKIRPLPKLPLMDGPAEIQVWLARETSLPESPRPETEEEHDGETESMETLLLRFTECNFETGSDTQTSERDPEIIIEDENEALPLDVQHAIRLAYDIEELEIEIHERQTEPELFDGYVIQCELNSLRHELHKARSARDRLHPELQKIDINKPSIAVQSKALGVGRRPRVRPGEQPVRAQGPDTVEPMGLPQRDRPPEYPQIHYHIDDLLRHRLSRPPRNPPINDNLENHLRDPCSEPLVTTQRNHSTDYLLTFALGRPLARAPSHLPAYDNLENLQNPPGLMSRDEYDRNLFRDAWVGVGAATTFMGTDSDIGAIRISDAEDRSIGAVLARKAAFNAGPAAGEIPNAFPIFAGGIRALYTDDASSGQDRNFPRSVSIGVEASTTPVDTSSDTGQNTTRRQANRAVNGGPGARDLTSTVPMVDEGSPDGGTRGPSTVPIVDEDSPDEGTRGPSTDDVSNGQDRNSPRHVPTGVEASTTPTDTSSDTRQTTTIGRQSDPDFVRRYLIGDEDSPEGGTRGLSTDDNSNVNSTSEEDSPDEGTLGLSIDEASTVNPTSEEDSSDEGTLGVSTKDASNVNPTSEEDSFDEGTLGVSTEDASNVNPTSEEDSFDEGTLGVSTDIVKKYLIGDEDSLDKGTQGPSIDDVSNVNPTSDEEIQPEEDSPDGGTRELSTNDASNADPTSDEEIQPDTESPETVETSPAITRKRPLSDFLSKSDDTSHKKSRSF